MQDTTMIGYVHGESVGGAFLDSVTNLLITDRFNTIDGVISSESGPALAQARNDLSRIFMEKTESEWLLMVDTDMSFPVDIVTRLRVAASRQVVAGALCFAFYSDARIAKPTMYDDEMRQIVEWPAGEIVRVGATGAACLLIHRHIFETTPYPWFTQAEDGSYGEDQGFCRNVRAAGNGIVVDTSTPVLHAKRILVGPSDYDAKRLADLLAAGTLYPKEQSE